jgi:hypothetical protein
MPDAVYEQALHEVAKQLVTIGTAGLASDPIQVRYLDWEDVTRLGGVTVRYEDEYREIKEGTNDRDLIGYPCHVIIVQGFRLQVLDEIPTGLKYKQVVRRYFHNKRRMTNIIEDGRVNEYGPTVVTQGPKVPKKFRDKVIHTLTVWAWFLEPRG